MKGWKKEIFIFAVSSLVILSYVVHLGQESPNRDDAKLREIQELSAKVPVFSGFKEVGSHYKSGYTSVDLTKYFYSTADYNEVKSFYSAVLEREGWALAQENPSEDEDSKELTFHKEQFSISIFHTKASSVYNYAIDFVWNDRK